MEPIDLMARIEELTKALRQSRAETIKEREICVMHSRHIASLTAKIQRLEREIHQLKNPLPSTD